MNILMMTNTFTPHIAGVARSVEVFTVEYRKRGHRVLVVAPEYENMPKNEMDLRHATLYALGRSEHRISMKPKRKTAAGQTLRIMT